MRVLELINESGLGGGQTHVLDLSRALTERVRYAPEIAAAGGGPLERAAHAAGLRFHALPFDGGPVALLRAIRALARAVRPAIVHTHGGIAGFWGRLACFGVGARLVHTLHGIHYLHYPSAVKRWAYTALDAAFARFTDRIICVCASDLAAARAAGVVVPERAVTVRNGIDVEAIRATNAGVSRAAVRARLGLSTNDFVFVSVARYHRQKGLPVLLDALALMPGAKLVLAGGGPEEGALRAQAARLGSADRITFWTDAGPAVAAGAYAIADAFCLPSLWEGLPLVLLEAWACGVPVVATAVDGTREIARPGEDALLVPPADPAALAGALHTVMANPYLARGLIAAGARRVDAEFGVARMAEETERVYDALVRGMDGG